MRRFGLRGERRRESYTRPRPLLGLFLRLRASSSSSSTFFSFSCLQKKTYKNSPQVTFGVGFVFACAYHFCQMDPNAGLQGTLWGVKGTAWRKVDILAAQFVMARSFGHFISSKCHFVSRVLTEAGFPVAVAVMAVSGALAPPPSPSSPSEGGAGAAAAAAPAAATKSLASLAAAAAGSISLGACSKVLLAVVLSAAASKCLLHGLHAREHARLERERRRRLQSFWSVRGGGRGGEAGGPAPAPLPPPGPLPATPRPFFPHATTPDERRRLGRAGLSILAGLLLFPLPEVLPGLYFCFHSLWHLAMARGVHALYCLIEGEPEPELELAGPAARAARAAAGAVAEAAGAAAAALQRLALLAASSSPSSSPAAAAARRSSSAARRRRADASRQHLQQLGGGGGGGGHRRVLSVVFEGEEEEEEEATRSSLSLDDVGGGREGAEASASAATSDAAARAATFLALSTPKAARFSPRTATAAAGAAGASCEGQEGRSSPLAAAKDGNDDAPCPSSSSATTYLGSLSSLFQAWASGGAPALSGILHASSEGRFLAAGKRGASGLFAVAASLLSSSDSDNDSGGDEHEGGEGGVFVGGARRRVAMLRRRCVAAASAETAAE